MRRNDTCKHGAMLTEPCDDCAVVPMTTPPSDTKVQSETLEEIADDLPYRIVEEMGLGLTFRSCTCGQLPCARLRPLREALEAVRRNERTRAASIIKEHRESDICRDNCWTTITNQILGKGAL